MVFTACLLLGLAASAEDLWRRRISNVTVTGGLIAGLAIQITVKGWLRGPAVWLAGAAAGFAVFLVFFLAGGMGGGDVKLMAAFGACLGVAQILRAALLAAMAGALFACAYLFLNWLRRCARGGDTPSPRARGSIPYAPAIFIGALLSLIG
jgi:prepilin peptidase CpaA